MLKLSNFLEKSDSKRRSPVWFLAIRFGSVCRCNAVGGFWWTRRRTSGKAQSDGLTRRHDAWPHRGYRGAQFHGPMASGSLRVSGDLLRRSTTERRAPRQRSSAASSYPDTPPSKPRGAGLPNQKARQGSVSSPWLCAPNGRRVPSDEPPPRRWEPDAGAAGPGWAVRRRQRPAWQPHDARCLFVHPRLFLKIGGCWRRRPCRPTCVLPIQGVEPNERGLNWHSPEDGGPRRRHCGGERGRWPKVRDCLRYR